MTTPFANTTLNLTYDELAQFLNGTLKVPAGFKVLKVTNRQKKTTYDDGRPWTSPHVTYSGTTGVTLTLVPLDYVAPVKVAKAPAKAAKKGKAKAKKAPRGKYYRPETTDE